MPGVIPSESNGLSRGSPSKKNRLSLKFFQKKETKRALDFTDSQENEEKLLNIEDLRLTKLFLLHSPPQ